MDKIVKDGYVRILSDPITRSIGVAGRIFRVVAVNPDLPERIRAALAAPLDLPEEHYPIIVDRDGANCLICACGAEPVDMAPAPGFDKFMDTALLKPVDLNGTN